MLTQLFNTFDFGINQCAMFPLNGGLYQVETRSCLMDMSNRAVTPLGAFGHDVDEARRRYIANKMHFESVEGLNRVTEVDMSEPVGRNVDTVVSSGHLTATPMAPPLLQEVAPQGYIITDTEPRGSAEPREQSRTEILLPLISD